MVKSVLQLKINEEDKSVFSQKLDKDFEHSVGDVFEYSSYLYNQLTEDDKILFKKFGLEIGPYRVQNKWLNYDEEEVIIFELYSL